MARFAMDFERPIVEMEEKLESLRQLPIAHEPEIAQEIESLEGELEKLREKIYSVLTPWQKVQVARHPDRPRSLDYIEHVFHDFIELHGDRHFRDDPAIVGGFAYLDNHKLMVIGHQKGKDTKENIARNFGMPHPEGYRKALRLMKLAEKFQLPLLCLIDTQGAYPGIGAEERGQAWAIAENLMEMSSLTIPIVVVNIGEACSGGALAIGVGDKILMLENAYYSVITPEGCASILWEDASKAQDAAEAFKLTADDCLKLGVIDGIIKEPLGGAHRNPEFVDRELRKELLRALKELKEIEPAQLVESRYEKFRKMGVFKEKAEELKS